MDRYNDIDKAIDYIEEHLTEDISALEVANSVYMSPYHFQRIFGMVCGITLGEYIRRRRLYLAAIEIIGGERVIDIAYKYGYETPESFSRAFLRFHGALPSKIDKQTIKIYPRINLMRRKNMDYKTISKGNMIFVGFKKSFSGVPYGEDRFEQENKFFCSTRGKQWLLIGASCEPDIDYCIVTNADESGYDFYIAYKLGEANIKELFDFSASGVNAEGMGFEILNVPSSEYAVFRTDRMRDPLNEIFRLRKNIAASNEISIKNAPEITAIHWRSSKQKNFAENRYIELYLPIN